MKTCISKLVALFLALVFFVALLPSNVMAAPADDYTQTFGYTKMATDAQKEAYRLMFNAVKTFDLTPITLPAGITEDDISEIAMLLPYDIPGAFYFRGPHYIIPVSGGAYSFTMLPIDGKELDVNITTTEIAQLQEKKKAVDDYVATFLKNAPDNMTDYEASVYVYEHLANRITYEHNDYDQGVYGALILGKCVCAGYANAYALLMNALGVKCWSVHGKATSNGTTDAHAWNVSWINGECVYTDVTWGDPGTHHVNYNYLNISGKDMGKDHTLDTMYQGQLYACSHEAKHESAVTKVKDIILERTSFRFTKVKATAKIQYTVVPASADNTRVIFESRDTSVAVVDVDGKVMAVGEGETQIIVRSVDRGAVAYVDIVVEFPSCKHTLELVKYTAPDCTHQGMKAHYACTKCGAAFMDENQHIPVDVEKLLLPSEHLMGGYIATADNHYETCSRCNQGLTLPAPHTFRNGICAACGYENQEVAPKPTTPKPTEPSVIPTIPTFPSEVPSDPTHEGGETEPMDPQPSDTPGEERPEGDADDRLDDSEDAKDMTKAERWGMEFLAVMFGFAVVIATAIVTKVIYNSVATKKNQ